MSFSWHFLFSLKYISFQRKEPPSSLLPTLHSWSYILVFQDLTLPATPFPLIPFTDHKYFQIFILKILDILSMPIQMDIETKYLGLSKILVYIILVVWGYYEEHSFFTLKSK